MTDSFDRLYRKMIWAQDAEPSSSRTARLFRRGRRHMAKKLGEEACEVVIDAISENREALVSESADLVYNLVALWVACGVKPADVWAEMERRERLFGIAEKMPKSSAKKSAIKDVSDKASGRQTSAHRLRAATAR